MNFLLQLSNFKNHSVHFISSQICKNLFILSYLNFIWLYTLSYVKIIDNCMDMTLWIVGLRIRIFNFAIKLLTCILYIVRVMSDSVPSEWWVYRYFFSYDAFQIICSFSAVFLLSILFIFQNRIFVCFIQSEHYISTCRKIDRLKETNYPIFFSLFRIKSMNLSLLVEICVYVTTLILKCTGNKWIPDKETPSYIRLIKYLYASNYYVMYEIILFWPRCSIWVLIYFLFKSIPSLSLSLLHLQLIYKLGRSLTGFEYRWL